MTWLDETLEVLGIAVVAVMVVKFVEPMTERFKAALHIASGHHSEQAAEMATYLKSYTLAIVVGTSLAHGMLAFIVEKDQAAGPGFILSGLIPGVITYCWLQGVRRSPSRGKLYGAIGGAVISFVFLGLLLPFSRLSQGEHITSVLLFSTLMWASAGFAGGLAIDNRWGGGPTRGIVVAVVGSTVLLEICYWVFYTIANGTPAMGAIFDAMTRDILRAVGWGAALLLYPNAHRMFAVTRTIMTRAEEAAGDAR